MIRIEVALNQSWMSWCTVINCNNKAKAKIRECLISDYLKIHSTHLIICHPKWKIYENFQTAIPKNKENMFIAILLSFFIIYFERTQAEAHSEPYQIFKMKFLAKVVNISRGVFATDSNI